MWKLKICKSHEILKIFENANLYPFPMGGSLFKNKHIVIVTDGKLSCEYDS